MKGKVRQVGILAIFVLLASLLTLQIAGAAKGEHTWGKIGFQTPLDFSAPQKLGLDAVALIHPPDCGLGQGQMEISLVAVPKDMAESMGNKDAEILSYVKTTFLGSATPAAKKMERSFLGKKVAGEAQTTSIPKKSEMELYLVPLADGDKVAVGFKWDAAFPKEKAESIIAKVAATFKEVKGK
jgi:hypothetical protein